MRLASANLSIANALLKGQNNTQWSAVLLTQHKQLEEEIANIQRLLARDFCHLLQLDKALKRLIKGVVIHLDLETCFLVPTLQGSELSAQQKLALTQSYKKLQQTCHNTSDYIHHLKLTKGNRLINMENNLNIQSFLQEISQRLKDEDSIYSCLDTDGATYAV
ncbi:hypothetical protein ACMXYV_14550 [Neptuniibacter sp. SY11_33]|uniref:hypothetical protein n=1 Tax=Neptuniibacter sp. SY11_33 TaxID=3398215 RepID=UPI0039F58ACB